MDSYNLYNIKNGNIGYNMEKPETTLIVGPSGCGKTWLLLNNLLLTGKYQHYDYIIILCSTLWINRTYLEWYYLHTDKDVIGLEIVSSKLDDILDLIVKIYTGSKVAIIVDDISHDNIQHLGSGTLSYLSYSGRHHNFSLFILSQKLNSIATGIRDNTTRLIFFSTHNKRSIDIMKNEFFGHLTSDNAEKLLGKLQIGKGKYLDINLSEPVKYEVKNK